MPSTTNSRTDRWCFTLFDSVPVITDDMKYMVYQTEVCPKTGKEHIQGYVRFSNRIRFTGMKKLFGNTAHIEPSKGSEEDNRVYCTKEGSRKPGTQPVEYGVYDANAGKQGHRTDLERVYDMFKSGATMDDVANACPAVIVKYPSGIRELEMRVRPKPALVRNVEVVVLWGPPRTGKTHRVRMTYPDCYPVRPGRDPWGSYREQKVILFDEFNYSKWDLQDMNVYLDNWACELDRRYCNTHAYWDKVFIIANTRPESWYPEQAGSDTFRAFLSRLKIVHNVLSKEQEIELQ